MSKYVSIYFSVYLIFLITSNIGRRVGPIMTYSSYEEQNQELLIKKIGKE